MRFKIGNDWYETKAGCPILVELTEQDKWNISHMGTGDTKYATFADDEPLDEKQRKQWMLGERKS